VNISPGEPGVYTYTLTCGTHAATVTLTVTPYITGLSPASLTPPGPTATMGWYLGDATGCSASTTDTTSGGPTFSDTRFNGPLPGTLMSPITFTPIAADGGGVYSFSITCTSPVVTVTSNPGLTVIVPPPP
jgi:hypothetical protein